jgi:hypothetical protein
MRHEPKTEPDSRRRIQLPISMPRRGRSVTNQQVRQDRKTGGRQAGSVSGRGPSNPTGASPYRDRQSGTDRESNRCSNRRFPDRFREKDPHLAVPRVNACQSTDDIQDVRCDIPEHRLGLVHSNRSGLLQSKRSMEPGLESISGRGTRISRRKPDQRSASLERSAAPASRVATESSTRLARGFSCPRVALCVGCLVGGLSCSQVVARRVREELQVMFR